MDAKERHILGIVTQEEGDISWDRHFYIRPESSAALSRMRDPEYALRAWRVLADKAPVYIDREGYAYNGDYRELDCDDSLNGKVFEGPFRVIVREILIHAVNAYQDDIDRRTTTQIRNDCNRVADLADKLATCLEAGEKRGVHAAGLDEEEMLDLPIEFQAPFSVGARNFEFITDDHNKSIWPEWATNVIRFVTDKLLKRKFSRFRPFYWRLHNQHRWFGDYIEKKKSCDLFGYKLTSSQLDELDLRAQVLAVFPTSDKFFIESLKNLSRMAREKAETAQTDTPKPQMENADKQKFCLNVCSTLERYFGSPCTDIVTDLATVVFNDPNLDGELVRKWWQRRK